MGIIGGLGPETTSEFYLDIIFSCQKKDKIARPAIIISSVPLPYKIEKDSISKNVDIKKCLPFLIDEAKRLEKAKVDFIAMPCNSLHIFIEDIRKAVKIPVLSIIEETVKFIKENKFKKVGVIATLATVENKLYQNAFKINKIEYEVPNTFQQKKIGKCILNLVNGLRKNSDKKEIINIINDLKKKNVDCIILACTDLHLLISKHPTLKIFDTMKIFANVSVKEILH